jgi:hypothetical protein
MSFSDLTGKQGCSHSGIIDFEIEKETQRIVRYPAGHGPKQTKYNEANQTYTAKHPKELCEECQMRLR